jgi:hypothetical protein
LEARAEPLEDAALRKSHALRIGLGFDLDKVGVPPPSPVKPSKPKSTSSPKPSRQAKKIDVPKSSIIVRKSLVHRSKAAHTDISTDIPTPAEPMFQASDSDLDPEEIDAELARLAELRTILGVK